jgi:mRNA interferase YafQ
MRNSELQEKVMKTLEQMTEDVFVSSLGTHKLGGNLDGIYACSCGYDCRVLFSIEPDSETESELIILLDVGNHDDVY